MVALRRSSTDIVVAVVPVFQRLKLLTCPFRIQLHQARIIMLIIQLRHLVIFTAHSQSISVILFIRRFLLLATELTLRQKLILVSPKH